MLEGFFMEHFAGAEGPALGASLRRREAHHPVLGPPGPPQPSQIPGWVSLEAACENSGDITELGHPGGVWVSPHAGPDSFWTLVQALFQESARTAS